MTQYEIGEIDLTAQTIAAKTATNYIAFDSNTGLKIASLNPLTATRRVQIASDKISIYNDDSNYTYIDSNGLTIYKGGNNIANFNDTIRLGKQSGSRIELNDRSFQMFDKDNNKYIHLSDLRDENGIFNVVEEYVATSSSASCYLQFTPTSLSDVVVKNNNEVISPSYYSLNGSTPPYFYFYSTANIQEGDNIEISYPTRNPVYAYTFGERQNGRLGSLSMVIGRGLASGHYSFSQGYSTIANGLYSHAEGYNTFANGLCSHAEGENTVANSRSSHAEGGNTVANGSYSHAEGENTVANSRSSHAEGSGTLANGNCSHAEGFNTVAIGQFSHAEGYKSTVGGWGLYSHAEGYNTFANEAYTHAEGGNTVANGHYSHAEGDRTIANGSGSHAEGDRTIANSRSSHAEGYNTVANGNSSHAEGYNTIANGNYSHAAGYCTIANNLYQSVCGKWNRQTSALFVVGSGDSDTSRKNALTIFGSSAYFNGTTSANGTAITSDIRVKENIKLLNKDESIQFINQLKPSSYIKNGDKKELGFIAQDIEKIKDYKDYLVTIDNSGEYDLKDYRLLNYQGLIAPTVAALQGALEKIEILENKIEILENKIKILILKEK